MLKVLSYLFPLWILLPKAKDLGSVTFSCLPEGFQCTIRPSTYGPKVRGINSWTGMSKSMGGALRQAMAVAAKVPEYKPAPQAFRPKLGGPEFDKDQN